MSLHDPLYGLAHNTSIKYENIRYDPEQAYDHTTGSYRCPRTGTYVFHVTLTSYTSHNGNLETMLVKNEEVIMRTTARNPAGSLHGEGSLIGTEDGVLDINI